MDASSPPLLPDESEIIIQIERGKADLTFDLSSLGIDTNKLDFHCQVKPTKFEKEFHYEDIDDADDELDFNQNKGDSSYDEALEFEGLEEDLHTISGLTGELMLRDYSETGIKLDSTGKEIVVRKSSICWLFSIDKYKFSSDRLQRVMGRDYNRNSGKVNVESTNLVQNEDISIGEWCIFEIDFTLVVGMVLSFCYTNGKSLKERAYTKSAAQIQDVRPIGVLGSWYSWNGELKNYVFQPGSCHSFVEIKKYKGTIPKPSYFGKKLTLNLTLLKKLDDLNATLNTDSRG